MKRRILVVAALVVLVVPHGPATGSPSEPAWAAAAGATIRPGVQIRSESGGCTTNFVFYEKLATGAFDVFIGTAAHCFTLGSATQTNGCTTPSRPVGSTAEIGGAAHPGTLAYSSWSSMKQANETNAATCAANDFALVRLDPRDHGRVNPSVLFFGGPHGVRTTTSTFGQAVYSYGNSSLRLGLSRLSPKRGVTTGSANGGWTHRAYTVTPGIPGDSGSGFLDAGGKAMGVVVTLSADGSNGITDLSRALSYARARTGKAIELASGTEAFTPRLV